MADAPARPYSTVFNEHYWSGGADEKWHVFIEGNGLIPRAVAGGDMVIGELGFGTGLSFVLAATMWLELAPETSVLTFISYELHPLTRPQLEAIHAHFPEEAHTVAEVLRSMYMLKAGWNLLQLGNVTLKLFIGDANEGLQEQTDMADAWFLDGFSPAINPDMWQADMLKRIGSLTKDGGTVATYTVARAVKEGLAEAGFEVAKVSGFPPKEHMLVARKLPS